MRLLGCHVTAGGVAKPRTLFAGSGAGRFYEELLGWIDDSRRRRLRSVERIVFFFGRIDRNTAPGGEVNDLIGRAEVAAHEIVFVILGGFARLAILGNGSDLDRQVGRQYR